MTTLPERRQGIDGLSRRPASVHPEQEHEHTAKPRVDHRHEEAAKPKPTLDHETDAIVSHPSLPVMHSQSRSRKTPVMRKLFVYPFTQKFDSRVIQLVIIKTLLDYRFWFVAILPFLAIGANRALSSAPAHLAHSIKSFMTSSNFVLAAAGLGVALVIVSLSMAVQVISRQAIMAIKIRSIDHRVSRASLLLRNASSNILKSWTNGFVNLVSFLAVFGLGSISLFWINSTSISLVVMARSYIFAAVLLGIVFVLGMLLLRRPLQRAMLSTTQMPISSLQIRSWRLVLGNVGLAVATMLFWALVMICSLSLSGLALWAMYVYLALPSSALVNGSIWLAGVSLLGAIWLLTSLWQSMYFASFYHILVLRRSKNEISDYLVPHEPMQFRLWPILVAVGLMMATLLVYTAILVSQYGSLSVRGRALKQMIPENLGSVVPRIGQH